MSIIVKVKAARKQVREFFNRVRDELDEWVIEQNVYLRLLQNGVPVRGVKWVNVFDTHIHVSAEGREVDIKAVDKGVREALRALKDTRVFLVSVRALDGLERPYALWDVQEVAA